MSEKLLGKAKEFIRTHPNNVQNDQFFLIDPSAIRQLIKAARVGSSDRVLEVGPGLGFLTRELAKVAKEVLAIEIERDFEPFLRELPPNVELVFGDAYRLLNNKDFLSRMRPPSKTVSSIPYSQAQNMLHNYTNWSWYQGDLVWLVPLSLAEKVNHEPILSAYFLAEVVEEVPKSSFYPEPNTSSAIIYFHRIPDPASTKDFAIYLRRWFYNNEDCKVKNTIREGVIKAAYDLKGKRITKNEARELLDFLEIPAIEQEKLTNNIRPEYYFEIPAKLLSWFKSL